MPTRTVHAEDGVPLHVWDEGVRDGPPVLLLHGIGQSGLVWRPLWTSPFAQRHRLVCPDLRGHGRSGLPEDLGTLPDASTWSGDIAAVLDGLGLDAPVVVGWSYGGLVALDHLAAAPDRLRALVLVNAPAGAGVPDARAWFDPGFLALAGDLTSHDAQAYTAAQRSLVERCTARPLPVEVSAALLGEAVLSRPSALAGVLQRSVDARPVLTASRVPLLVVVGDDDRVITAAAADALSTARPDAQVVHCPGGHAPFLGQTAAFVGLLERFLDGLPDEVRG